MDHELDKRPYGPSGDTRLDKGVHEPNCSLLVNFGYCDCGAFYKTPAEQAQHPTDKEK